jgi:hypothetical protein
VYLYKNKEKPWKAIFIRKENYRKSMFFTWSPAPNNHWMKRPRGFLHLNLFFISAWRDNCNFKIGVGFGKRHISLVFQH